jgi:hypothetical protein
VDAKGVSTIYLAWRSLPWRPFYCFSPRRQDAKNATPTRHLEVERLDLGDIGVSRREPLGKPVPSPVTSGNPIRELTAGGSMSHRR